MTFALFGLVDIISCSNYNSLKARSKEQNKSKKTARSKGKTSRTIRKSRWCMANKLDMKETASFEEVLVASAFQQEAILNILEKKGLLSRHEVMQEILELKKKAGK